MLDDSPVSVPLLHITPILSSVKLSLYHGQPSALQLASQLSLEAVVDATLTVTGASSDPILIQPASEDG